MIIVVNLGSGWTAKGDRFDIYSAESDGSYRVQLITFNNLKEIWKVPEKDINPETLLCLLQGPLEACKKGPFGRKYLVKHGHLILQLRLPPR